MIKKKKKNSGLLWLNKRFCIFLKYNKELFDTLYMTSLFHTSITGIVSIIELDWTWTRTAAERVHHILYIFGRQRVKVGFPYIFGRGVGVGFPGS